MEKKIKTAEEQIFILKFPNEEYNANDFNDWAKENSEEAYRYCLGAFKALLSESLPSEREAELLKKIDILNVGKDSLSNTILEVEQEQELKGDNEQIEYKVKVLDEQLTESLSAPVSEVPTDLKKYIDGKFKYDSIGQYVWIVDKTGGHQKFADLRGWGAIQNLFKKKNGEIDLKAAEEFQDKVGKWLVSVLNNSVSSKLSGTIDEGKKEGEWISVEERLPDNAEMFNDRVLFVASGIIRIGCYDYETNDWTETGGGVYKSNVTHWMLLPKVPKEEGK